MKKNKLLFCALILALPLGILSCSAKAPAARQLVLYPPPPEHTKIQYLASISDSHDVSGGRSGFMEYIAGKEADKQILKPYGIAIHQGRIFVCDTILGGLEVVDLEKKTFDYLLPDGKGKLKKPINCFKDQEGKLYVADIERAQIVVFDENDQYLAAFGTDDLTKPIDVFVTGSMIYVADLKKQKVEVFSKENFQHVASLPKANLPKEQSLYSPTNIYVRGDRLYVTDFGDFKIKIYSLNGDFLQSVGSYGKALGQFVRPKGIAVDPDFNLYVVDAAFENVQIFSKDGKLLMFFGGSYKVPGDMWLPAKVVLDFDNLRYFEQYVEKSFSLKYLIFVTNQYGPDKINVYGFVEEKS